MGVVRTLKMLRTEKSLRYWRDEFDAEIRGDDLDDYVDLGEKAGAPITCVYCPEPYKGTAQMRDHHLNEHPDKRYDPIWYVDA